MRFRSKGQPKGQMLAREQRRVTFIIAGVGLLALMLIVSGKLPSLTRLFSEPAAPAPKAPVVAESLLAANHLNPDEVEFVPSESPADVDYASMIDPAGAAQMEDQTNASYSIGDVPLKLTRTIRDDVLGVMASEAEAWFGTLRLAERISPDQKHLIPEGQFPLFMDSPQSCRGKAFTIRGQLRRMLRADLPASAETFGIRTAYDAWISTQDSGNQLIHVIALTADPGLPVKEHTGPEGPEVELTGYFFKREGYAAKGADGKGELGLTPLILAHRIRSVPPRVIATRADDMNPWLTWFGLGICCLVLVIVWQFQAADNGFRGTRTHQLTNPPVRPSFEGVEAVTVQQVLQEMEEHAQATTPDTTLLS